MREGMKEGEGNELEPLEERNSKGSMTEEKMELWER